MKKRIWGFVLILIIGFAVITLADTHVTGEIKHLRVYEDGRVQLFINNPRGSAEWNCDSDAAWLGAQDQKVDPAFLSQAIMVFTKGYTMRFGVRNAVSTSCEIHYITALEIANKEEG